jgi:hypothetical protein
MILTDVLDHERVAKLQFYIRGLEWDNFMFYLSETSTVEEAVAVIQYVSTMHGCYTYAFSPKEEW